MNTPDNEHRQPKAGATSRNNPLAPYGPASWPLARFFPSKYPPRTALGAQNGVQRVSPVVVPAPAVDVADLSEDLRRAPRWLVVIVAGHIVSLVMLRWLVSWPFVWFLFCYLLASQALTEGLGRAGASVEWVWGARVVFDLSLLWLVSMREWFWELCWERSLLRRVIAPGL